VGEVVSAQEALADLGIPHKPATVVTQASIRRNLEKHAVHNAKSSQQLAGEALVKRLEKGEPLTPGEAKLPELPGQKLFGEAGEAALKAPAEAGKAILEAPKKAAEAAVSGIWKGIGPGLVRIGKVIAGAIIILLGLWLVLRALSPGAAAAPAKAAGAIAKVAR
jgi:hypothetical protein